MTAGLIRVHEGAHRGLEAWVDRWPAFDCIAGHCVIPACPGGPKLSGRAGGPRPSGRSHGRSHARDHWVVRGEGLAISWTVSNPRHSHPATPAHYRGRDLSPTSFGLTYHSAIALSDDDITHVDCPFLGITCHHEHWWLEADGWAEHTVGDDEFPDLVWDRLYDVWAERMRRTIEILQAQGSG